MEETLLSAHSEALSEIEAFCDDQGETADLEKAWEMIKQDKTGLFHTYVTLKVWFWLAIWRFDIEYTVDTELRSIRIKDKDIEEVEAVLANLTFGQPYLFSKLEKSDIYLAASKLEDRDCILVSGYRSNKIKNYRTMLINGNRALIVTLFGCMSIIIILIGRLYMKQQKRAMKGQARYDILSEFSDTVLFWIRLSG